MNKEKARQAAIEWCVIRTRDFLLDDCTPTATITEKDGLFLGQMITKTCIVDSKEFPFHEIKAPPRGIPCFGMDNPHDDCGFFISSGDLDEDGWLISDDDKLVAWKHWQVLGPINSEYNNTGE